MADHDQTTATPNDCLLLFSSAISSPPGSFQQRSSLTRLKDLLGSNPSYLPILYPSLLSIVSNPNQSSHHHALYRKWVAGIIELAVCRPTLASDQRLSLVLQSTETIHRLITLQDPGDPQLLETKKLAIQAFASAYPILFKHSCTKSTTTADSKQWGISNQVKGTILSLWRNENTSLGIKLAANKLVQKVIQVGTRGVLDPRKRNEDPSIVMCGTSSSATPHPYLKAKDLEQEASNLLEESIRTLFQTKIPEMAAAIVTSLGLLHRLRPTLSPLILSSLSTFNPLSCPLGHSSTSILQLKGVEKTLRITLSHLDRSLSSSSFSVQIREALVNQSKRLNDLTERERERKRQRKEGESGVKKRARADQALGPESHHSSGSPEHRLPSAKELAGFDVTSLPVELVAELVIANLQVLTEQALKDAVAAYVRSTAESQLSGAAPPVQPPAPPTQIPDQLVPSTSNGSQHLVRSGSPVRPKIELVPPSEPPSEPPADRSTAKPMLEGSTLEPEDEEDKMDDDLVLESLREGDDVHARSPDKSLFLDNWEADRPIELTESSRRLMIRMSLDRIARNGILDSKASSVEGMWSVLLARLVTRGMATSGTQAVGEVESRREDIRRALFHFVVADFPNRMHFARVWLIEEWLTRPSPQYEAKPIFESIRPDLSQLCPYDRWLNLLLDYIVEHSVGSTPNHPTDHLRQTLSNFLQDLPYVPERELARLGELCQDPAKLSIGFTALRDLTSLRPTLRNRTLDALLGLCTHSRRQIRNAAIMTVKGWVTPSGTMKTLGDRVISFAVQLLQGLEKPEEEEEAKKEDEKEEKEEEEQEEEEEEEEEKEKEKEKERKLTPSGVPVKAEEREASADVEMEDGETTGLEAGESTPEPPVTYARVEDAVIISGLSKLKLENVVVQHLELLLALSVKNPDLLDHLFRIYPNMPPHVQESVNQLITPLIRTLGGKHHKIIGLIQTCQSGSEPLALRILSILTEKGKPPPAMVEAIKSLAATSNNLSPRFIVPTIADLSKAEIMHHVPRIITLLNGTTNEKALIRSVFESIVQQPPSNFGSASTNAPRVKQTELLTPVELLALLHRTEDAEYNLRQAIEAIGICFSMTEIFKPEVLAAFMQQVVDELTLPTLFLRTVIQAVQTYKSLQAFVSTTLLSRLILKKIWTQPQLWEGFMRCAKIIAPHSFGALLQLPRDQLKELVAKQSSLRSPLREYVNKKAGNNKSRVSNLMEILSDSSTEALVSETSVTPTATVPLHAQGSPTGARHAPLSEDSLRRSESLNELLIPSPVGSNMAKDHAGGPLSSMSSLPPSQQPGHETNAGSGGRGSNDTNGSSGSGNSGNQDPGLLVSAAVG